MRRLNFLSIEYFLKTAETLNFTEAARELFISQPALSKQIKQLEHEIGVHLFVRDKKQVELTEGGRILYEEWSDMLARSEKAISAAKSLEEKQLRMIRIGIVEFSGVIDRIAPVLEQFTEEDSHTEVIYEVHGFSQLRRMLDKGEVDLIITLNTEVPSDKRNILMQVLCDMQLYIVVPSKHPLYQREEISFRDLADETIFIFSEDYSEAGRRSILKHFEKEGVAVRRIKEFPNIRSMEVALVGGGGVTIGYRSFFELTEKLRFFPIPDRVGVHQLVAAWKEENGQQVQDLVQFCREKEI